VRHPRRIAAASSIPDLPEDLRVTRAGQHFIVFVEMPEQVIVVDVLHSRSDLPRRLAAMGRRRTRTPLTVANSKG
jgi:plasmid stabilization system protein ParE